MTLLSLLSMFSRSPEGSLLPLLVAAWWLRSPLSSLRLLTQWWLLSPLPPLMSVHTSGGVISAGGAVPAIYNSISLFQDAKLLRAQGYRGMRPNDPTRPRQKNYSALKPRRTLAESFYEDRTPEITPRAGLPVSLAE